ncbi:hypothetical protein HY374_00870 [Candidatus Berkelbacteria bacterium]|nr:hypothetical protein [Candidatus Berkelbacteria bacterium]
MRHTSLIFLGAALLIGGGWYVATRFVVKPIQPVTLSGAPTNTTLPTELDLRRNWSRNQCQGQGDATFTHRPMRPEDTAVILPYGLLADAHVTPIDHMYFSPADRQSAPDTYEVRAIADGYIVQIGHRVNFVGDHKGGNAATKQTNDWRLDIEHSCDLYSYFDLITSLEPDIMAEVADLAGKMGSEPVRIPIKAGQLIGHIGGQTLDFGVYDNRVMLDFINPLSYVRESWKVHTVDPFPFFEASVRQTMLDELARFVEPRAGKIDYDIDGRLIGNWFREGTNGYNGVDQQRYWDGHLAVVPDYLDPTNVHFSIGNFGGTAKQFSVVRNSPRPEDVSVASGIVEYELASYQYVDSATGEPWMAEAPTPTITAKTMDDVLGVALIQLAPDGKLKVEVFPGKTAGEVTTFTAAAALYVR